MTTRDVLDAAVERWNAHDRDGWTGYAAESFEVRAPGGFVGAGKQGAQALFDAWTEAFPDNHVHLQVVIADGPHGMHESRFTGTHDGTMHAPSGDIPATGRRVDLPFTAVLTVEGGEMTSFRVYFDQLEMLGQLGLTGAAPQPAAAR